MAVANWSGQHAAGVVKIWMFAEYPNTECVVEVSCRPYNFSHTTEIRFRCPNGDPMHISFETSEWEFTAQNYRIPDETKAQLMLLLG